jgi:indolepyruvate ferredoxin oxidoreductase
MSILERRPFDLGDRYQRQDGEIFLSGLQALVRIPLDQHRLDVARGLRVGTLISGYEGSPLAGYDLEIAKRSSLMEAAGVVFRPSVNEELGANAVQGSQLASASPDKSVDGVVGIWYGKAPGLDRATDALRHGNLGGAHEHGGVLVLVGDDSIAKSSTVPSASEVAMAEIGMTVLVPADPQDVLHLGLHGIALSRFCGLWTGFKLATNVVDGAASASVATDSFSNVIPSRVIDGEEFTHEVSANFIQPGVGKLEESLMGPRVELAKRYAAANGLNVISGDTDAKIGLVAAGATYLDVCQALTTLGLDPSDLSGTGIRLLKLGMVSPLEPNIVTEFASGLDEIVVVEEKRSFVEAAVKDLLYGRSDAPRVSGRRTPDGDPMFRASADLPPEYIAEQIAERIVATHASGPVEAWRQRRTNRRRRVLLPLAPVATRTPFFCSGCPHNRSTETPAGSLVGAGIGCSALATLMPSDRVGDVIGFTQMGGEGGSWIGMSPFVTREHLIQNVGDGTFHHSASLALRAAVASGTRMTYKILYNGAVAMTGGQQAVGKMSTIELTRSILAEGVATVVITTDEPSKYRRSRLPRGVRVAHRDELVSVQEELATVDGVTVIIHDQECATELRRKRKRKLAAEPDLRVLINERVCEGCGDCGRKSNCLSVQPVQTEFGRKTQIHQASCNKDFSCLDGDCPAFVSVKPGKQKAGSGTRIGVPIQADDLPHPELHVDMRDFNLRITGVGGTGIVTVAQVIATAATISGMYVRSLDQMGMAQKGGAVVSDIRLGVAPINGANKVGPGECDLYLGCDLLVAASEVNVAVLDEQRSIAIVSTAEVPTGPMVADVEQTFPEAGPVLERVLERSRRSLSRALDARELALSVFGDDQFANVLLLGVAIQAGALPIAPEIIEEALTHNGVAVDLNIQAFRWGRRAVAEPEAVQAALASAAHQEPASGPTQPRFSARVEAEGDRELDELVVSRANDLVGYQNAAYADQYVADVNRVAAAECTVLGAPQGVATSYARNLYKLMAYKDEYEVARLSLDPRLRQSVKEEFGPDARYYYRLHPPVLRALGMKKKLTLGSWFNLVFRVLYAARVLRGSKFDVFGYGTVRATERALVTEYRDLVERAMARLDAGTLPMVQELVSLPDGVRGYEHVKLDNVHKFRAEAIRILDELNAVGVQ